MTNTKHTPTPWINFGNEVIRRLKHGDYYVAKTCVMNEQGKEDAAYIVKAVNEREKLLSLLSEWMEDIEGRFGNLPDDVIDLYNRTGAALAAAEAA